MNSLDISFIIVSWNVAELLDNCIHSILENVTGLNYEIIVVDNCSTDHTIPMLQENYPMVKVIANSINVGFAKANNQGFQIAIGTFHFILNPDTIVCENSVYLLNSLLVSCPDLGMVGPRLILPNQETQNTSARLLPTLSFSLFYEALRIQQLPLIGKWVTKTLLNPYDFEISQPVEAISGAAMLVRSEIIQKLKGFGENYLHGGEDVDLCFQVRNDGWKIYYEKDSEIIHYFGQSSSQVPIRTAVNYVLSQYEYFANCYGRFHAFIFRLIIRFVEVPVMLIIGLCKYVLHSESGEKFKIRLEMAKAIFRWEVVK